jgi:hypothetical protein
MLTLEFAKGSELAALHNAMQYVVQRAAREESALYEAEGMLAAALRRRCGLGASESSGWLHPSAARVRKGWRM